MKNFPTWWRPASAAQTKQGCGCNKAIPIQPKKKCPNCQQNNPTQRTAKYVFPWK